MKKYFQYFVYVIKHKYYVARECFKRGWYWRGIVHDMSKFLPSEFFPYARYFFGGKQNQDEFEKAVLKHYHRNPHHWQHWVLLGSSKAPKPLKIDDPHLVEMVCDLLGMDMGDAEKTRAYFLSCVGKWIIHPVSKHLISKMLCYEDGTK